MTKKLALLFVLLIFSSITLNAQGDDFGQPNDPTVNENANACLEGGTLEGRCNQDFDSDGVVSEFEQTWAWECGWYLIRYEVGMLGSVPERCQSVIPVRYPICYDNGYSSFALVKLPNRLNNTVFFNNSDLECMGEAHDGGVSIVVSGDTGAEAFANCDALGTVVFLERLQDIGYLDAPYNHWGCVAL